MIVMSVHRLCTEVCSLITALQHVHTHTVHILSQCVLLPEAAPCSYIHANRAYMVYCVATYMSIGPTCQSGLHRTIEYIP